MPFASNREFVTLCYERYLRREPDDAGLAGWVKNLVTGTLNRMQVEAQIMGSDEFFVTQALSQPMALVSEWYLRVLGQPADAMGSQTWLNRYNALGGNKVQLAQEFLAAAGYTRSDPPPTCPLHQSHTPSPESGHQEGEKA